MSYTSIELIRHHLTPAPRCGEGVTDQPHIMKTTTVGAFFNGSVEESSLRVKSARGAGLTRTEITLEEGDTVLAGSPLSPGSVAVASDTSLGRVYIENLDYVVDYARAALIHKDGGSLSTGSTVAVWFRPYAVYQSGVDYRAETAKGRIRRLSGGSIAEGETVLLDFVPLDTGYTEQILANAVAEANGLIEREIDPNGEFGFNSTLQTAATYRALESVCRVLAARELSRAGGDDRCASVWLKLADAHGLRSEKLLSGFRPPLSGPTGPARA